MPAIGFDVPLLRMAPASGDVNPATFTDAYLIEGTGYGTPHGGGTAYVAMHSGRGVDAVGNALIDVDSGTSTVPVGAELDLDGIAYVVTDVRMVDKAELTRDSDLWSWTDDRAVVFTCLQRPTGRSRQNVVVIAQRQYETRKGVPYE